ncbi:MAG: hypothetical protein FJ265_01770 [Planctomycetes bacterium]|nr:hypothetical protein [Planctomycetota bacterium]
MRIPSTWLAAALAALPLAAQGGTTAVQDVGLTLDGGMLTVIYGRDCGPFTCQPMFAGPVGIGQQRIVSVYGAPSQVYVLAFSLASLTQPCILVPGIGNALILGHPIVVAIGVTSPAMPGSTCQQGRANYPFTFPPTAPPGMPFEIQGLAISPSLGVPAFTIALRSQIL